MPITHEDIVRLATELGQRYFNEPSVGGLLAAAGVSRELIRALGSTTPLDYWRRALAELEEPVVLGLLARASRDYPGCAAFKPFQREDPTQQVAKETTRQWKIHIPGNLPADRIVEILSAVSKVAKNSGHVDLDIGFGEEGSTDLFVSGKGIHEERAGEVQDVIQKALREAGISDAVVECEDAGIEDYYMDPLYVEGPDQRKFGLEGIRASTKIRDVSAAVMEQYPDEFMPEGKTGAPRRVVLDHVQRDGAGRRLHPDTTLHDAGVRPHDVLRAAPEARAGAVNPIRRYESIVAARNQIIRFQNAHPGFEVDVNDQDTPTEYLFRFRQASYAPGNPPELIPNQEVLLVMLPDFPVHAPFAVWQHPIFHPNIAADSGLVCLGTLSTSYTPGLDFGIVCQMLVDMAGYRTYVLHEGYNMQAVQWVQSPEGREAIARIGGTMPEAIYGWEDQLHKPRPLRVRRLDP